MDRAGLRTGPSWRYRPDMKKQPAAVDRSITGPMLKPILDLQANKGAKKEGTIPSLTPEKLKPAAEYQDDGGGYNSNLFFPQE